MKAQKSVTEEIQELREMRVPELVERYEMAFGKHPRVKHREWLWRKVAWKIQEQRFGGLSQVAKKRLGELIEGLDIPLASQPLVSAKRSRTGKLGQPNPGTTLVRAWRGTEIRATKVEGGWEHEGVVYKSLSALAKAVTGSHMSGPAFFGLTKKAAR